ncbi:MAG: ADP-forming succinate--CoA ligase subunit beta [Burkholderiaceae bacterium]|nr:ADP-forming succinate--CoA ligase subunit beta [Burkholderiaceae bacterium]
MKIHEYQAREILSRFGVPIPKGIVAKSAEEAVQASQNLGGDVWAVKAQVHAGGRGKGGGVKVLRRLDDVKAFSEKLIGSRLVTPQTGPEGAPVGCVLVQEGVNIVSEYYVSFLVDRVTQQPLLLASSAGGMEIERVAVETPEKIVQVQFDIEIGLTEEKAITVINRLGMPDEVLPQAIEVLMGLWKAYVSMDCTLLEINPLVVTADKRVLPLDVKMVFDDNALYRHPELEVLHDPLQEDPTELRAHNSGLQYIPLGGNIACLVNGAGLAMATMDTIKLFGGEPANFLDIGGGASTERVTAAFQIMVEQPEVKVILVNIFGGIMKCDVIAEGVVHACRNVKLNVPLIVRMKGTHEDIGKKILDDSGLPIVVAETLDEAAQKAIELANKEEK